MSTLSTSLSALGHSFAWALLHSLWQAGIIYLALVLLLKVVASTSSRAKYNISFSAFSLLVLWFGNTWVSQYEKLKEYTVLVRESAGADAPDVMRAVRLTPSTAGSSPLHFVQAGLEKYFPLVLTIYSVGLLLMMVRLLFDFIQVRRLRSSGIIPEPGNILSDIVQDWADKLNIGRNVQLLFSSRIHIPVMMGIVKPVILLPIASVNNLTEDQLEAILLHELAHIKRFDYLYNIIQAIVETVLFFNPFVWLMSSAIRLQREHCCDDMVLACSARPMIYATALSNLEYNMSGHGLAQAATGEKGQLFNRIKRIMEMKNTTNKRYSRSAIVAVAMAAFAFTATMLAITPSFAQKIKKKKKEETASPVPVTVKEKVLVADDTSKKKDVIRITRQSANGKEGEVDVHISYSDGLHKAMASVSDSNELGKVLKSVVIASKDFSDAMSEVGAELDAVDWDAVKSDIRRALEDVDRELNSNLNKELNVEIRKQLEKSREALEESRKELKEKLVIVRDEAFRAKAEAEHARAEIHAGTRSSDPDYFESILNKMDHDGLIDRNGKFKIEKEGDELYINGKAQPKVICDKYKRYLDHKTIVIKGNGGLSGTLTIKIDD